MESSSELTSLNFSTCGLLYFLAFPHVEETTLMGDVPGLGVLDMEDGPGLEVPGMEVTAHSAYKVPHLTRKL